MERFIQPSLKNIFNSEQEKGGATRVLVDIAIKNNCKVQ